MGFGGWHKSVSEHGNDEKGKEDDISKYYEEDKGKR